MKRIIALLLACLLVPVAFADPMADKKVTSDILGTRILNEWNGQSSEEYDWFVVDIQLTNWHTDKQNIDGLLSGKLVFRDAYIFEGNPAFDGDSIAPLVEKKGALVFEIPKMISRSFSSEDVDVSITVEGEEKVIDLDASYAASQHTGPLEGPGYETPEEAVLAYLEGMNNGNATEMLSTFALESYVEHVDPLSYVTRLGSFQPYKVSGLPLNSNYAKTIMLNVRYGDLARQLFYQYTERTAHLDGQSLILTEASEIEELLDQFKNSPVDMWLGRVEFVEWVNPSALSDVFLTSVNLCNIAIQMACAGADDYTVLAAHIRLNGVDAIQTMGCIKYGDRWYNLDFNNNIAFLLRLDGFSAGLLYPDEGGDWDVKGMLAMATEQDPEASQIMESWENSDLLGTSWALTSLNDANVNVVASSDGIREATESCVYAKLRFMHYGGAIADVRFSPTLDSEIAAGYSYIITAAVWVDMGGKLQIGESRGLKAKIDISDADCIINNDTLVIKWGEGMQATFQRIDE